MLLYWHFYRPIGLSGPPGIKARVFAFANVAAWLRMCSGTSVPAAALLGGSDISSAIRRPSSLRDAYLRRAIVVYALSCNSQKSTGLAQDLATSGRVGLAV